MQRRNVSDYEVAEMYEKEERKESGGGLIERG